MLLLFRYEYKCLVFPNFRFLVTGLKPTILWFKTLITSLFHVSIQKENYQILHVDDDLLYRNLIEDAFDEDFFQGYDVTCVGDTESVYAELDNPEIEYDLLITDLEIPNGEEGMLLADNVQENYDIPVLMNTSRDRRKYEFFERAPDEPREFLSKGGMTLEDLRESIDSLLE